MLDELTVCEEVFHTASGVAFADFITEGHRETWPIRSKRFRTWLRRCYKETAPPPQLDSDDAAMTYERFIRCGSAKPVANYYGAVRP